MGESNFPHVILSVGDKPSTMKLLFSRFLPWHQFNTVVLSSKVGFNLYFRFPLHFTDSCLGTQPQLQTAFIFRFPYSERVVLVEGFHCHSKLSTELRSCSFLQSQVTGEAFRNAEKTRQHFVQRKKKATNKEFQNQVDTTKRKEK